MLSGRILWLKVLRPVARSDGANTADDIASARGIKALQQQVKAAARSYLSKSIAALKEDWNEFWHFVNGGLGSASGL